MAMDEAVRLKYRELVRTGFHYAEKIENPTIFLNTLEEGIRLCSASTNGFMNIFIEVKGAVIEKARYMCSCDPTANVVVETMCELIEGKTLDEVKAISGEDYYKAIGSRGEALVERVRSVIELINRGIDKHLAKTDSKSDTEYHG